MQRKWLHFETPVFICDRCQIEMINGEREPKDVRWSLFLPASWFDCGDLHLCPEHYPAENQWGKLGKF